MSKANERRKIMFKPKAIYFEKEIELTAIIQGCNCFSGFPYWVFFYREL